jgi:hypothetical protein
MQKDERDLLEVLKFELQFLQDGGYGRSPRTPWRPLFIFEDSPSCVNFDAKENRVPCNNCVLMDLVPPEMRSARIPCRHIPLNASGDTLDSLYRYGEQQEIEEKVAEWLRGAIQQVEKERIAAGQRRNAEPPARHETMKGTPLYRSLHPKCANPACPTAFHWTSGGKFFRFRPDPVSSNENNSEVDTPKGIHGVRHYWLCERCSQAFILIYDAQHGVVLKALWPELRDPAKSCKASAA